MRAFCGVSSLDGTLLTPYARSSVDFMLYPISYCRKIHMVFLLFLIHNPNLVNINYITLMINGKLVNYIFAQHLLSVQHSQPF